MPKKTDLEILFDKIVDYAIQLKKDGISHSIIGKITDPKINLSNHFNHIIEQINEIDWKNEQGKSLIKEVKNLEIKIQKSIQKFEKKTFDTSNHQELDFFTRHRKTIFLLLRISIYSHVAIINPLGEMLISELSKALKYQSNKANTQKQYHSFIKLIYKERVLIQEFDTYFKRLNPSQIYNLSKVVEKFGLTSTQSWAESSEIILNYIARKNTLNNLDFLLLEFHSIITSINSTNFSRPTQDLIFGFEPERLQEISKIILTKLDNSQVDLFKNSITNDIKQTILYRLFESYYFANNNLSMTSKTNKLQNIFLIIQNAKCQEVLETESFDLSEYIKNKQLPTKKIKIFYGYNTN